MGHTGLPQIKILQARTHFEKERGLRIFHVKKVWIAVTVTTEEENRKQRDIKSYFRGRKRKIKTEERVQRGKHQTD